MNDAERLARDPTFRLIGSKKIWERGVALPSRLQSFETEMLAEHENFAGLSAVNRELIAKAEAVDSARRVVLDMDSTEIPVYGQREQSAYNGHFAPTTGKNCCCRKSTGNRGWATRWCCGRMRILPSRSSTRRWRSGA